MPGPALPEIPSEHRMLHSWCLHLQTLLQPAWLLCSRMPLLPSSRFPSLTPKATSTGHTSQRFQACFLSWLLTFNIGDKYIRDSNLFPSLKFSIKPKSHFESRTNSFWLKGLLASSSLLRYSISTALFAWHVTTTGILCFTGRRMSECRSSPPWKDHPILVLPWPV